jgi:hypothetical protein
MRSTNRNSFIRSLKSKGFKEEIVIKIGLYDLVTSTTLESNKSHTRYLECPDGEHRVSLYGQSHVRDA